MSGQGSAGNVLAALCSFFIPGLGQLVQGRLAAGFFMFGFAVMLWFLFLGWIMNIVAALEAALFKSKEDPVQVNVNLENNNALPAGPQPVTGPSIVEADFDEVPKVSQRKRCHACGDYVEESDRFCKTCGAEL